MNKFQAEVQVETKQTYKLTKDELDKIIKEALGIEGSAHIEYDMSGGFDGYDNRYYAPYKLRGVKITKTTTSFV